MKTCKYNEKNEKIILPYCNNLKTLGVKGIDKRDQ